MKYDWEAIERDFRTGKFTLKELSAKHGPGYAVISRKASAQKWEKDLRQAVKQATSAAIIAETTKAAQREQSESANGAQTETTVAVLAAAELNKQVILGHRSDLTRARAVALDLLEELGRTGMLAEHEELLAEILAGEGAKPDDVHKARQAVSRALSVHARIGSIKSMLEALTKAHQGERVAFALDDEANEATDALSDLIAAVQGAALKPR